MTVVRLLVLAVLLGAGMAFVILQGGDIVFVQAMFVLAIPVMFLVVFRDLKR